jgi:hypothetical protein
VESIPLEGAGEHFGWFAPFATIDVTASSALTRELMEWDPTGPGLIEDLQENGYFRGLDRFPTSRRA